MTDPVASPAAPPEPAAAEPASASAPRLVLTLSCDEEGRLNFQSNSTSAEALFELLQRAQAALFQRSQQEISRLLAPRILPAAAVPHGIPSPSRRRG